MLRPYNTLTTQGHPEEKRSEDGAGSSCRLRCIPQVVI